MPLQEPLWTFVSSSNRKPPPQDAEDCSYNDVENVRYLGAESPEPVSIPGVAGVRLLGHNPNIKWVMMIIMMMMMMNYDDIRTKPQHAQHQEVPELLHHTEAVSRQSAGSILPGQLSSY